MRAVHWVVDEPDLKPNCSLLLERRYPYFCRIICSTTLLRVDASVMGRLFSLHDGSFPLLGTGTITQSREPDLRASTRMRKYVEWVGQREENTSGDYGTHQITNFGSPITA